MVVWVIMPTGNFAQNRFGIMAGAGISRESINLVYTSGKIGYEVIASYNILWKDDLNFRINSGYKQRGHKYEIFYLSSGLTESDFTVYHLLTIGPDLIIPLNKINKRIYFYGGLTTDYLVDYKIAFEDSPEDAGVHLADSYSKIQFSADARIGMRFNSSLFVEFRGNGNFINKIKDKKRPGPRAFDYYFGLTLGYHFKNCAD